MVMEKYIKHMKKEKEMLKKKLYLLLQIQIIAWHILLNSDHLFPLLAGASHCSSRGQKKR